MFRNIEAGKNVIITIYDTFSANGKVIENDIANEILKIKIIPESVSMLYPNTTIGNIPPDCIFKFDYDEICAVDII